MICGLLSLSVAWSQAEYARQDALVFQATYYAPLDTARMAQLWHETVLRSESYYNGDGSWGLGYSDWPSRPYDADHPLIRVAAWHILGLLRLMEVGLSDSTTERRVRLGLDWLLSRQTEEGAWPLYTIPQGLISARSIVPTALAGRAMSRAYLVLADPTYREAATRALRWAQFRPPDGSALHQGLELAALLEHYRVDHEYLYLERALAMAGRILNGQLVNGSWGDPSTRQLADSGQAPSAGPSSLTTAEHGQVTESLLMLTGALADGHPQRRRLRAGVTAALNFLLESQLAHGGFAAAAGELAAVKAPSFEIVALIRASDDLGMEEFDGPISGALRALGTHFSNTGILWRSTQGGRFLAVAEGLVWFANNGPAELPGPGTRQARDSTGTGRGAEQDGPQPSPAGSDG